MIKIDIQQTLSKFTFFVAIITICVICGSSMLSYNEKFCCLVWQTLFSYKFGVDKDENKDGGVKNFIRRFYNFPNGVDTVVSTVAETSSLWALFLGLAV